MSTFAEALSKLASAMMNPKSQKPTLDQRWTQLSWEFQNFYNELTNSHQPWTENEVTIPVTGGTNDYLVPGNVGNILFAYATPADGIASPIGIDISELSRVSSDFGFYNLLDFGVSRDFNELLAVAFPLQIAFFRNAAGSLYFRVPPVGQNIQSITLVYGTGDWIQNLDPDAVAILSQYHMLPIVRAAINLLPGSEWPDEKDRGESLSKTLVVQEGRYAQQFLIAKRSFTADSEESYRVVYGEDW